MQRNIAVVFGASNYFGLHLVNRLAHNNWYLRLAEPYPEDILSYKTVGQVGQVVPLHVNFKKEKYIRMVMRGASCIINLVGLNANFSFSSNDPWWVNCSIAKSIAYAASQEGIQDMIHVSCMYSQNNKSRIARSILAGEREVLKHFPRAIIVRPNIIFGSCDRFLSYFSNILGWSPICFVPYGYQEIAPIYVEDVVQGIMLAFQRPQSRGHIHEFYGSEIFKYVDIVKLIHDVINSSSSIVPLDRYTSYLFGLINHLIPKTFFDVHLINFFKHGLPIQQTDTKNITLNHIGVNLLTPIHAFIAQYIAPYKNGGIFQKAYLSLDDSLKNH